MINKMDRFQKFLVLASSIINDVLQNRNSNTDYLSYVRYLVNIYEKPSNFEDTQDLYMKKLLLAIYLYRGDVENSTKYLNILENLDAYDKIQLSKCAFYSYERKTFELMFQELSYYDDIDDYIDEYTEMLVDLNFEEFKHFWENDILSEFNFGLDELAEMAFIYNIPIFKYLIENEKRGFDVYKRFPDFPIDPELLKFLITLPEVDTFWLEEEISNSIDEKNISLRGRSSDFEEIRELNQLYEIIRLHNDKFRIFKKSTLNDELRKILFPLLEKLEESQRNKSYADIMASITDASSRDQRTIFDVSTVLDQIAGSEISILEKEISKVKNEFYEARFLEDEEGEEEEDEYEGGSSDED